MAGRAARFRDSRYGRLLADPRLLTVMLVSMTGTLGAAVASPALPGVASGLGVTEGQTGLVMSAFFLPSIVAVPVVGLLADGYGRRRFVLGGLATFGVAGAGIALVDSFAALLALRAVQGVGYAGLTPLAVTVTGDLFSGPDGAAAQGLRESAHGVGQVVMPAAAGVLAGLYWGSPFLLYAVALPILGIAVLFLPETAPAGGVGFGSTSLAADLRGYAVAFRAEVAERRVAVLMLGGFVVFFLKISVVTFIPLYAVRALGAEPAVAGLLISLLGAARFIGAPLAGSVLAALPRRRALLGAIGIAAGGAALVPAAPSLPWLVGAVLTYAVGAVLMTPILNDTMTAAVSAERRGGVISAFQLLKSSGMVLAPAILGVVLTLMGFPAVFLAAAGLAAGYAALALWLLGPET